MAFDFEAVGPKNMYLMYHEELESLAKFVPELERIATWFENDEPGFPKRLSLQKAAAVRAAIAEIQPDTERPALRRMQ